MGLGEKGSHFAGQSRAGQSRAGQKARRGKRNID